MVWYRELGFYSNPFSIKPGAFHSDIVGYDLTEVLGKIEDSKIIFIEGEYGFGKTTILKHVIRRFGGNRKLAYYNCNRSEGSINVAGIIKGSAGFFGRLSGMMPSDIILLLDEVEKISPEDQKELISYFKEANLKSIVFFGPDFDRVGFGVDLRKLMVNNVIKLTQLTEAEAIELVRERVGNLKLISDEVIRVVFKHSANNPRLLLENLEDLARHAVDNNEEQITSEHLKEVLGISEKLREEKKSENESKPAAKSKKKKTSFRKPKAKKPKKSPEKPKETKVAKAETPEKKPVKAKEPEPRKIEKPKKPKVKEPQQKKAEKPKEPKKVESAPHILDKEEDFDTKPKKKGPEPPINEDFEEEDYSEPADEEDQGGEYYYYY